MTRTELILVRHGETVWNLEGRRQGQSDSPLTAVGRAQARAIAERLRAERVPCLHFVSYWHQETRWHITTLGELPHLLLADRRTMER